MRAPKYFRNHVPTGHKKDGKRDARFAPGTKITCKHAVRAYYSDYAGMPTIPFEPGTVATVVAIAPKVRIAGDDPLIYDQSDEFIVADFYSPVTRKLERVSLNFVNARRVPDGG